MVFDAELPTIYEDMKNKIWMSSEPIGDWFLFKNHTIIRVYGSIEAPYVFPTFLKS